MQAPLTSDTTASLTRPTDVKMNFRSVAIFGLSLIVFCFVANFILLLVVHVALGVALKAQTNGWSEEILEAKKEQRPLEFFSIAGAGVFNLSIILAVFWRLGFGLEFLSKDKVFKQDNSVADFYKLHSLLQLALLMLLVVLIGLGIVAFVTPTPRNVMIFGVVSFLYTYGCSYAFSDFMKGLEELKEGDKSEKEILRENVGEPKGCNV